MKIDFEKLVNILNMTQSENDNEALTAIRIANAFLAKNGSRWSDVIKKKEKEYKYKDIADTYDITHFLALTRLKEFTDYLTKSQREAMNSVIRFVNAHGYIPQNNWTDIRGVWHDFRESTAIKD